MNTAAAFGAIDREIPERKIARLLVVCSLGIFVAVLAVTSLLLIWIPTSGGPPVSVSAGRIDAVERGSDAARAGLRPGDILAPDVTFFQREALANFAYFQPTRLSFDVLRDGHRKHVTLDVKTLNYDNSPTGEEIVYLVVDIFVFLVCVIIGTIVVLLRPARLTWAFFVYCVGAIIPLSVTVVLMLVPLPYGFLLEMARIALSVAGLVCLAIFALHFPSGEVAGWRKGLARILPLVAVGYAISIYAGWVLPLYSWMPNPNFFSYGPTTFAVAICAVSACAAIGTYRSCAIPNKERLKWAVLGIVTASVALAGRWILFATNEFWSLEWLGWLTLLGAFFAPLAVAYAILRHRVIDVQFVVNRAVVYLSVTSLLAITLGGVYWLTNLLMRQTQAATLVQVVIAIGVGVALHKLYRRLDSGINRMLFRTQYEAQEHLQRIAQGLERVESIRELEVLIAVEPVLALDLACGAVYHKNDNGDYQRHDTETAQNLPAVLTCEQPLVARARAHHESFALTAARLALALPLYSDGSLVALALYGPHTNGTDLNRNERSAISALQAPAERAISSLLNKAKKLQDSSEVLQGVADDSSDGAHLYLAKDMLTFIPERTKIALTAAMAIPNASAEELETATENPQSSELLRELSTLCSAIRFREPAEFYAHGLLRRAIAAAYPQQCVQMLARCAKRASEQRDYTRAAELYRLADMPVAAMQEWENVLVAGDPVLMLGRDDRAAQMVLYGDLAVRCPHLWIKRSISRVFVDATAAQAREGRVLRDSLQSNLPEMLEPWCAYLEAEAGDYANAYAALGRYDQVQTNSVPSEFACVTAALVAGRMGQFDRCEDQLRTLDDARTEECRALCSLIRGAVLERARGNWASEHQHVQSAIDLLRARDSRFLISALSEAVAGAWLAGHERAFRTYRKQLREAAAEYDAQTIMHFIAAACGEPKEPSGTESSRWLAYAYLIRACDAEASDDAKHFATMAIESACSAGEPFLKALAYLACAVFEESHCNQHLRRAFEAGEAIESTELHRAMEAMIAGENNTGMLSHFASRLRRNRQAGRGGLSIDIAAGTIRRGAAPIVLSERELALAFALARSPTAISAAELSDLIWPDLDLPAGMRAVQTCVHRLRQRLGDPGAIESTAHGYRLRDDTVVDIIEIERFIRNLPRDGQLDRFTALRLAAIAKHLDGTRPAYVSYWEWFTAIERRINEWSRAAKLRLAQDALSRGEYGRVLALSQQIRARDELDEPAWEMAIRALVQSGNRAEAKRELRRYREVMLRELNEPPASELYDLLEGEAAHAGLRMLR